MSPKGSLICGVLLLLGPTLGPTPPAWGVKSVEQELESSVEADAVPLDGVAGDEATAPSQEELPSEPPAFEPPPVGYRCDYVRTSSGDAVPCIDGAPPEGWAWGAPQPMTPPTGCLKFEDPTTGEWRYCQGYDETNDPTIRRVSITVDGEAKVGTLTTLSISINFYPCSSGTSGRLPLINATPHHPAWHSLRFIRCDGDVWMIGFPFFAAGWNRLEVYGATLDVYVLKGDPVIEIPGAFDSRTAGLPLFVGGFVNGMKGLTHEGVAYIGAPAPTGVFAIDYQGATTATSQLNTWPEGAISTITPAVVVQALVPAGKSVATVRYSGDKNWNPKEVSLAIEGIARPQARIAADSTGYAGLPGATPHIIPAVTENFDGSITLDGGSEPPRAGVAATSCRTAPGQQASRVVSGKPFILKVFGMSSNRLVRFQVRRGTAWTTVSSVMADNMGRAASSPLIFEGIRQVRIRVESPGRANFQRCIVKFVA